MMLGLREGWFFVGRYCSESSFLRRRAGVERITPQLNSSLVASAPDQHLSPSVGARLCFLLYAAPLLFFCTLVWSLFND